MDLSRIISNGLITKLVILIIIGKSAILSIHSLAEFDCKGPFLLLSVSLLQGVFEGLSIYHHALPFFLLCFQIGGKSFLLSGKVEDRKWRKITQSESAM